MQIERTRAGPWRPALASLSLILLLQACGGGGADVASQAMSLEVAPPAAAVAATAPTPAAPAPAPERVAGTAAPSPTPAAAPVASAAPTPVLAPAATAASGTLIGLTAATSCSIPNLREAVLQRVNGARSDGYVCGTETLPRVPALQWNDILFSAAARHTLDMVARNYFAHDTPEGVTFWERLSAEGYGFFAAGENIASGQSSVDAVIAAWLGSEPHCRNIMNPLLTEVAVACANNEWTMDLGGR